MALFGRRKRTAEARGLSFSYVPVSVLERSLRLEIHGESFHLPYLRHLQSQREEWWAVLVREPDNPHDQNAVAVYIEGQPVGHIAREQAAEIAQTLDRLQAQRQLVTLHVTLYGGANDKPNIGVFADFPNETGHPVGHYS